jgi:hypothetical protein
MRHRLLAALACTVLLSLALPAQMQMGGEKPGEPLLSPPATAKVILNGKAVTISYSSPRKRGRKIMGDVVPYGEVWRVGANDATTLVTTANLKVGTLDVPAGTYTLFALPNQDKWLFIVSKKTGEWGIPYPEGNDLGRTPMTGKTLPSSQENMSISFENTKGATTELHVKWDTTDQYVPITAK